MLNASTLRERAAQHRATAETLERNADELERIESTLEDALSENLGSASPKGKRGRPAGSKNKRRGRPPGSKNKAKVKLRKAKGKRGRPPGSKNKAKTRATRPAKKLGRNGSLKALIVEIMNSKKAGISLEDMVTACRESGYESDSKKFHQMVANVANGLVKAKAAEFDEEDRKYRLVKSA